MREREAVVLAMEDNGQIFKEEQSFYSSSFEAFAQQLERSEELPMADEKRSSCSDTRSLITEARLAHFRVMKSKGRWYFGFSTGYQKEYNDKPGRSVRVYTEDDVCYHNDGKSHEQELAEALARNQYHEVGLNDQGKRCFIVDCPNLDKHGWDYEFGNNLIYALNKV